jgi:TATA-binding protein-associated factor
MREIERFFPGRVFQALALSGTASQREALWNERLTSSNIVVTNYSVLRSDIDTLATKVWRYCILDEGHLLKNPKTGKCASRVRVTIRSHRLICILFAFTSATARASRRIRANHKLILTGTPVQNNVNEVWATFDFLMPNYLGSSTTFGKEFARPISKSQVPGASADEIASGMDKLKILHQQVLPFILRREKEQVLKELPPKIITVIPCDMSDVQRQLYSDFCAGPQVQRSLDTLQRAVQNVEGSETEDVRLSLGSDTLK